MFKRNKGNAALRIAIHTQVDQDYLTVFRKFDQELFLTLAPPLPKFKLLRFDGSQPGDMVAVELNFGLFRQTWTSLITESQVTDEEAYFVDQGQQLPWPLTFWRHQHLVKRNRAGGAIISDIIQYRTAFWLFNWLLYPVMLAQFSFRKPIYRRYFK